MPVANCHHWEYNLHRGDRNLDFSSYLKETIKKRGYSYRKLGELSGVNHSYISKICAGTSGTPTPDILRKLSFPLCIPYEELLRAAGYLFHEGRSQYPGSGDEELQVRVAKLSSEGKQKLSEFLDYLEDLDKKRRKKSQQAN